jgi:agmatinase
MKKLIEHHDQWSGLISQDLDAEIAVLGIPFDRAVSWRAGAAQAPQHLRTITPHLAFSTEEGVQLDVRVKDYGDLEPDLDWERFFHTAEIRAAEIFSGQHQLAIFLGGDHSITIPLFKAFAAGERRKIGYIQLDSHPDLASEFEGHSWSHACTARRNLEQPNLFAEWVAFVGLRSFLAEEIEYQATHPTMGWHTARSIYQYGIEPVARQVVAQLAGVETVYLSLDIDVLDPACAPGTGTPEHGGLTARQCLEFLRIVFAELPVKAMDIVEISPPLDVSEITSLAGLKIIYEVFGFVQQLASKGD